MSLPMLKNFLDIEYKIYMLVEIVFCMKYIFMTLDDERYEYVNFSKLGFWNNAKSGYYCISITASFANSFWNMKSLMRLLYVGQLSKFV